MSVRIFVDRGLLIRAEIEKLEAELEEIEGKLIEAGKKGTQVDLVDENREGKQFLASGSKVIVPVIFTADKIVGTFQKQSAIHQRICAVDCGKFLEFYTPVNGFKNLFESGKKFRAKASEILGDSAPPFITACLARDKFGIPKSDIKIEWDAAKPLTQ